MVHVEWPRGAAHTRVTSVMLAPNWRSMADYVYVGMPCAYTARAGMTDEEIGPFGKPWECLRDPRGWRAAYREYLWNRLARDIAFRERVAALHGKTLVCFCKGSKRGADADCHGDMLAHVAELIAHRGEA